MTRVSTTTIRWWQWALSGACSLIAVGFAGAAAYYAVQGALIQYQDPKLQYGMIAISLSVDCFKVVACHLAMMRLRTRSRIGAGLAFVVCACVSLYLATSYARYAERTAAEATQYAARLALEEAKRTVKAFDELEAEKSALRVDLDKKRAAAAGVKPKTFEEFERDLEALPRGDRRLQLIRENSVNTGLYNKYMEEVRGLERMLERTAPAPTAQMRVLVSTAHETKTSTPLSTPASAYEHLLKWVSEHLFAIGLEIMVLVWVMAAQIPMNIGFEQDLSTARERSQAPTTSTPAKAAQAPAVTRSRARPESLVQYLLSAPGQCAVMSERKWGAAVGVAPASIKSWSIQLEAQGVLARKSTAQGLELKLTGRPALSVVGGSPERVDPTSPGATGGRGCAREKRGRG